MDLQFPKVSLQTRMRIRFDKGRGTMSQQGRGFRYTYPIASSDSVGGAGCAAFVSVFFFSQCTDIAVTSNTQRG